MLPTLACASSELRWLRFAGVMSLCVMWLLAPVVIVVEAVILLCETFL